MSKSFRIALKYGAKGMLFTSIVLFSFQASDYVYGCGFPLTVILTAIFWEKLTG